MILHRFDSLVPPDFQLWTPFGWLETAPGRRVMLVMLTEADGFRFGLYSEDKPLSPTQVRRAGEMLGITFDPKAPRAVLNLDKGNHFTFKFPEEREKGAH